MNDDLQLDALSAEQLASLEAPQPVAQADSPVSCGRLIGVAGSGKSYQLTKRTTEDPSYGLLTATTGIAAINVGAITLHSTLKFSDTASLVDAHLTGRLARTLHEIALDYRRLIIEEYSMLHADQFDVIYRGVQDANKYRDLDHPLGILLVGDLAQLPPVKGEWVFRAEHWGEVADNTERLDKVWRQDGGAFLDGLNLLRAGSGVLAADVLSSAGAKWHTQLDNEFDGTTILPKNDMVNRFNAMALDRVRGAKFTLTSRRWGKQRSEWGESRSSHEWGIPPTLSLKVGALVMVLANSSDFSVVNGDTGHVVAWDETNGQVIVKLSRTGQQTAVSPILRDVSTRERPDGWTGGDLSESVYYPRDHYGRPRRRYVTGQIEYFPLRLAYATTVHKSQGLTLDAAQIDFRDWFFSRPGMLYVALSRVKTLAGLRLVGTREKFAAQCSTDSRVLPWI